MRRIMVILVVIAAVGGGTALAAVSQSGGTKTDASVSQYGGKNQGCTPGFWKNHHDTWSVYSPTDKFDTVFGVSFNSSLTLAGALNLQGGGFNALARHATAALLNSAHDNVGYNLTTSQVIALVQNAFATNNPEPAKDQLADLNEMGCSIDAHGRPIED